MKNKETNNKVILNLFQNLHLINNKKNEEMLKQVQHDGMRVRAFTLIELLVVVLIIGILAAVALPKYQVAVQKSRYATLMPLAKSVKNAEEEILMARGGYTETLADLSVQVPDGEETTITPKDTENESYVKASKNGLNNRLVMYLARSKRYANEIHCEAEQDNKIAKQICLSYGGNTTAVTGTVDSRGYDTYVLQGTGADAGSIPMKSQVSDELWDWLTRAGYPKKWCGDDELKIASFYFYGGYDDFSSVEVIDENNVIFHNSKRNRDDAIIYKDGSFHACYEYTGTDECLGYHTTNVH